MNSAQALGPKEVALAVLCLGALVTDIRERKIKNIWLLPFLLFGLGWAYFQAGTSGLGTAFLGALAGFALFFPLFALGGVGAGDAKFFLTLGAFWTPSQTLKAFLLVGIFAALGSLVVAGIDSRNYGGPLGYALKVAEEHKDQKTVENSERAKLPWSIPMVLAVLALAALEKTYPGWPW